MFIILFLFYDTVYLLKISKISLDFSKIFIKKRFHMNEHCSETIFFFHLMKKNFKSLNKGI